MALEEQQKQVRDTKARLRNLEDSLEAHQEQRKSDMEIKFMLSKQLEQYVTLSMLTICRAHVVVVQGAEECVYREATCVEISRATSEIRKCPSENERFLFGGSDREQTAS